MTNDQTRLLDFIDTIYECSSGAQGWEAFLQKFGREFPAVKSAFVGYDTNHAHLNFALLGNYEESFAQSYLDHYGDMNPWYSFLQNLPALEQNVWAHDVVPLEQLHKTEFYNDWVKPQEDISTGFATDLMRSPDSFLNMACNVSFKHIEEGQRARKFLLDLTPHLKRGFKISQKINGTRSNGNILENVLDRQSSAVLVIDEKGRLAYANKKAEMLLREGKMVRLGRDQKICFVDKQDQNAMCKQVEIISGDGRRAQSSVRLCLPADRSFIALVSPVSGGGGPRRATREGLHNSSHQVMITLIDQSHEPRTPRQIIVSTFGTTPAETRLALGLVRGLSVRECADQFGITYNTARTQLRSLFAKLDVRNQSHLILSLSKIFSHAR